jgi:hypothetical protein
MNQSKSMSILAVVLALYAATGLFASASEQGRGCTDDFAINYDSNAIEDNGTCIYAPSADLNGDDKINSEDLIQLLSACGNGVYDFKADLDQSGIVDNHDINTFFSFQKGF